MGLRDHIAAYLRATTDDPTGPVGSERAVFTKLFRRGLREGNVARLLVGLVLGRLSVEEERVMLGLIREERGMGREDGEDKAGTNGGDGQVAP